MGRIYREFSEDLWCSREGKDLTIGVLEDSLNQLEMIQNITIGEAGDSVEADEMIGDLSDNENSIYVYAPVSGEITEINQHVIDHPELLYDDPNEDSWLFKMHADDEEDLDAFLEEPELVSSD
jgi:glycine cleavage system H protein